MNFKNALAHKTVFYQPIDNAITPIATDETQEVKSVALVADVVKQISQSSGDLFLIRQVQKNPTPLYKVHPRNKVAEDVLLLIKDRFADQLQHLLPNYEMNPYFGAFVGNDDFFHLSQYRLILNTSISEEGLAIFKRLNCFVEAIRQDAKRPDFRRAVENFERAANKNHASLMSYINALFRIHSKLLTLRVDLSYRMDHERSMTWGRKLTYDQVSKHRDIFFHSLDQYLKDTLGKDALVGYAWKAEYGIHGGWHFHTFIFLDGQQVREDVTVGRVIGEYWESTTTEGVGRYFNCNSRKDYYRRLGSLGIGMIDYRDRTLRKHLEEDVATYVTKVDACIKLKLPEGARAFGRGIMPKQAEIRRGRPRIQPQENNFPITTLRND